MKREFTFKSLLVTASVISFMAFAFVNIHGNPSVKAAFTPLDVKETQVDSDQDSEEMAVPDVSVLGRVLELAQRFLFKPN